MQSRNSSIADGFNGYGWYFWINSEERLGPYPDRYSCEDAYDAYMSGSIRIPKHSELRDTAARLLPAIERDVDDIMHQRPRSAVSYTHLLATRDYLKKILRTL